MCSFTPALLLLADPARPFMGRCVARPAVYLCVADCVENSHICRGAGVDFLRFSGQRLTR